MSGKRAKRLRAGETATTGLPNRGFPRFVPMLLSFVVGVVLAGGGFLLYLYSHAGESNSTFGHPPHKSPAAGHRTVAQLMALPDAALEKVDVLEMNIAVAREIPGLEKLDYDHYRQIVGGWTDQFRRWLPTVESGFRQSPDKYKNDINFFRLGMLAQFLDETVGVRYVPEQKQAQVQERKDGRHVNILYTKPGDLLVHGLIDTKQGTCGNMPTLHVIIGRWLGWPVALACAKSHYVCRYDDGKVYYNIEATDTGRGGFAEGSDKDYMEKEGVSPKAVACGSDLRKLSAREMLGTFVSLRARHFADTENWALADRDYALSRALFPTHRQAYKESLDAFLSRGAMLFDPSEQGHPSTLLAYLSSMQRQSPVAAARPQRDPMEELERINAINRTNRERMMQPPL